VALDYQLQLGAGESAEVGFVIAGSERGEDPALESYRRVHAHVSEMESDKHERYREMLARNSLQIPEPSIVRAWDWVKCNFDWLVRAAQPWGRGLGAGVADYPWWFGCDNGYALRGCLALGQHDIATDTLDLLRRVSAAANDDSGRVIHEANTRGFVTDFGRTEETPHFTRAVWDTFLWTGDVEFVRRNYPFCKLGLLQWTLGDQTRDGDPLPYGYGVMEMLGLNLQCVDTASLTVEALVGLAGMAEVVDDASTAERARGLAEAVRTRMEEAFWMEPEGLYGDMVATPAEMAPRLQHWMEEAKEGAAAEAFQRLLDEANADHDQERKRPWLLKNWSVLSPLEGRLAPPNRALRTLERAEGPEFTGPWGVYICGTYRSWMMSIATGVMAAAEAEYNRPEQALGYIRMLTDTLDMQSPGAIAEMSPDFGCFVQAWSGYAVAWPVVAGIFGVRPDAFHRRIELTPSFPAGWSDAQLTDLVVGTNRLDLRWDGTTLSVTSREPGWDITCDHLPVRLEQSS
jgi:glycogen debranching enzyme